MVFLIGIHTEGGTGHEHITMVEWFDPSENKTDRSYATQVIGFLESNGVAKVTDGKTTVDVGVVNGEKRKYLRTHANGKWTDNLLSLPRF